jgi:hypothetical protein
MLIAGPENDPVNPVHGVVHGVPAGPITCPHYRGAVQSSRAPGTSAGNSDGIHGPRELQPVTQTEFTGPGTASRKTDSLPGTCPVNANSVPGKSRWKP